MDGVDDIAIIGIGCRVPGADNAEEFWRVLVNGENPIIDVPKDRWNNDAFYSEDRDEAGKTYVKKAGFIKGHDEWDNKFFGVSDNEAVTVDPQQRIVLDCAHMALEDAGITRQQLKGSQTGVYIGVMNDDYKGMSGFEHKEDSSYSATGMSTTIISARVSYVYDLHGPCMVVDTACSSSMMAIHLGSQAIKSGDCEMAVCGGVSLMLTPDQFMILCKAKMLSPTGQCQSFCDTADGYARGEGCGIVMIKSYKQALHDRNKIWGIIKTGSNQDGHTAQPITAPSGEQQEKLLKKVYSQYNLDPISLQYIEAHGTGTPIGDPTEINAIGKFIQSYRQKQPHDKTDTDNNDENEIPLSNKVNNTSAILIGSVKSNIGHLESAAGVAALIKVLLMMKHGKFVPSLHVEKDKSNVNRKIILDEHGLDISLQVSEWNPNKQGDRICCVNCFGFGGSNTHAVVIQKRLPIQTIQKPYDNNTENAYKIIFISDLNKTSLKRKMEVFAEDFEIRKHDISLNDISFTSVFHRDHFTYRTLIFGKTADEILQNTKQKLTQLDETGTGEKLRIIFVFCGVGTTWKGMCIEMMKTQSVFKKTVSNIDEILKPLAGSSIAEMFQNDTDYSDPFINHIAIFCTQVALFELWKSWGICPQAVIGQSVGEVAAAYASGALHLKDAIQVIYYRSKILSEMTGGKMMVAGNISVDTLESLCKKYSHRVIIAVYNSPVSCTLSGDADAMEKIKTALEEMNKKENAGIMITPLPVQCAYHSHHMEPCTIQIENELKAIEKGKRTVDHYSTVTGQLAEYDEFQTGKYWAENIRKPVLFMNAIRLSLDHNATNLFVEIGPRQVVRAHLMNILGENIKGKTLPSMDAYKECQSIYSSLRSLLEHGADLKWERVVPPDGNIVSIPRHVFQKTKQLNIPEGKQRLLKGITKSPESHLFIRQHADAGKAGFQIHIDKETSPFVYDHYMYNSVLVPGATYVETAFEIAHQQSPLNVYEVSVSLEFVNTLMPKNEKQCVVDVEVENNEQNGYQYYIRQNEKMLCKGNITPRTEQVRKSFNIETIKDRCKKHRTREENYECLSHLHFQYGETLRVIDQSWSSSTECIVEYRIPESVMRHRKATHMHPSVIDGMFQTAVLLGTAGFDRSALPKGFASFVINRPPQSRMFGYTTLVKSSSTGNYYNLALLCPDGQVLAEAYEFYIRLMTDGSDNLQNMQYCVTWQETEMFASISQSKEKLAKTTATVFASERFLSFYKPLPDESMNFISIGKEGMFRHGLSNMHKSEAVIFAPLYHIEETTRDGIVLFEYIQKSFMNLSVIISVLREQELEIPIFVVTENVMGRHQKTTNVCGAELWGMVRSAVAEGAYRDIKLIDMTFTGENTGMLQTVLKHVTLAGNEYLIENGKVYHSVITETNDQELLTRREIHPVMAEKVVLKSLSPRGIKHPYLDMRSSEDAEIQKPKQCKIRLKELCLHDSSLFLFSPKLASDDENIITEEESGYPVICIEGVGSKYCCSKPSAIPNNTGFCFPVCVSAVISVPLKCSFDIDDLQFYVPGMITVGVILLNIVDTCKNSSRVTCIVDDESRLCVQLLKHLFSTRTSTSLIIETFDELADRLKNGHPNIRTVIILAKLTCDKLDAITKRFSALQRIVSMECFFSKEQKMLMKLRRENILLHILKAEDMFSLSELTEKVPKVYSSFKSITNKAVYCFEQPEPGDTNNKEKDIFCLPYSVLILRDDNGKASVPLKVSEENVFRTNGCYIVVGGLTGLGWELVQLIASLGAKYIATLSRSLPDKHRENEIEKVVKLYSCQIIPIQADITDLNQLKKGMEKLRNIIGRDINIRGVLHGGGVTCDKFLKNMSETDVKQVLLPKVLGTWNLHYVTLSMPLDFFIMHSSVVSVFGNQGQCNYAAGNSFQDSFAHYRRGLGLCGQSINWSTLSLGMAMENTELQKYLRIQGFYFLSIEEIKICFMQAVMKNQVQVMFGKFDWLKMQENPIVGTNPTKFREILKKLPTATRKNKETDTNFTLCDFVNRNSKEQEQIVYDLVKSKIVEAFVVDESTLSENTTIVTLGIDSMAAMNFSSSVFDETNVRIPIETLFVESTSLGVLMRYILTRIQKRTDLCHNKTQQADENLQKYLQGNVTFMQKSLLDDFVKDPFSRNILIQVDFEIKGISLKKRDWKVVVNHLIKINPDLRRIYNINGNGSYQSVLLDGQSVDIDINEVEFSSICTESAKDERDKIHMDITKELPIRIMIAFEKGTVRVRMFVHAVLGDLSGMIILFREINDIAKCYIQHKELPVKDEIIVPAEAVRKAILPRTSTLKTFWKAQLKQNIKPFTLSDDINMELDEKHWENESLKLPPNLVHEIMDYIKGEGVSMYHFVISIYMILLHEKTGKYLIPVVTNIDMRGHVPQLKSVITRCSNAIPIIGDLGEMSTVSVYLKKNSDHLNKMTQHGAYPYELIEKEMQSKELAKHIGRHRLIMENMTNLNASFEHEDVEIRLGQFYYKRHVYETTLHIVYDTQQNVVILEFGYNGKAITKSNARQMLDRMLDLMWKFIEFPQEEVKSFLDNSNSVVERHILTHDSSRHVNCLANDKLRKTDNTESIWKEKQSQCSQINQNVIREDVFTKQTKQGWEHSVKLKLVKHVFSENNAVLKMIWGRGKKKKTLYGHTISEVEIKRLNGMIYILVKTLEDVVIFKTSSHSKAKDWLATFKQMDRK
ncbi:phenolphthiocerol/phthiocerol polyketide synthase subunit C-like [Mercenaria mercenaria]|uniref:phenolphthiocerol/phthiocerol polyketide synthase subunit C-like n=1 Tax=Mercenaria mercenaria TaxID=6596 RepID=UPI00234F6C6B|nr:phenolphthiocerol/phthiocerol polyketide synthase subunit C-like [Mercenaria mercenaria]